MIRILVRRLTASVALACVSLGAQASPRPDSAPALDEARLFTNLTVLSADSMEGRLAGSPGSARARAFLISEFVRIGLQPLVKGYAMSFSRRSTYPADHAAVPATRNPFALQEPPRSRYYPIVVGDNLVGVVRGTLHPERYIVVSAHYDHLGVQGGAIFHGADDNASGSAAILAIAEWTVAHPPQNSIIFAWFDAEEEGLVGSAAFVDRPPVPLKQIIADVNLDMVSRSAIGQLNIVGAGENPEMQPFIDSVAALGLVRIGKGHGDLINRSDQGSFHAKQIPFVLFNNDEHEDYHQPTDEAIRINPGFFLNSARTAAAFLRILDGSLDEVARIRQGRK